MYQLNLADKNLYASLEDDAQILKTEQSAPSWTDTQFSETNLAPFVAYDNGEEKKVEEQQVPPQPVQQPTQAQQAQPIQHAQPAQPAQAVQAAQPDKSTKSKPKRSIWGFIKFALIVILLALIIYFTIYRIGWGVTECSKRNYHDCAALLTPELSTLALTSIML
jgi:hypothetical protein